VSDAARRSGGCRAAFGRRGSGRSPHWL